MAFAHQVGTAIPERVVIYSRDFHFKKFAARTARSDERHYEHDLKKAVRQADDAEADAADAVSLALYLYDEAEYAVIDAVVARAVADDLALEA